LNRRDVVWLGLILLIVAASIWAVQNPDYPIRQGLDLQGGLQVLLEADVPEDQVVTPDQIDAARQIIDQRVNALGVAEPLVQVEEERRILVELPGIDNPRDAIALIQETALLEFIDTGDSPLPEGTCVRTSQTDAPSRCELQAGGPVPEVGSAPQFDTVLTGSDLREATAEFRQGQHFVSFLLQNDAADFFADYTRENQGKFLTIVLDKQVISSPRISTVIEGGAGTITGDFTVDEAHKLALQLRFGSLPVPLRIASTRQVGATLGELSITSSIEAGTIGLVVVLLFMLIYYRLPGLLADLALLIYAMVNLSLFKLIPVTLTLPAITGFVLSTGMAVDANILVFERMKEEIRKGSSLKTSVATGFNRAWSSIRDSNIATLLLW